MRACCEATPGGAALVLAERKSPIPLDGSILRISFASSSCHVFKSPARSFASKYFCSLSGDVLSMYAACMAACAAMMSSFVLA
jgi:hypothetical protein